MLRRLMLASAIAAFCVGPAAAQNNAGSGSGTQDRLSIPLSYKPPPTPEEIEKQKAADKAYDAAIHKIPDKKTSSDPWGTIRPATSSSSQAKNKHQHQTQQQ